jgi:two-component system, OmpR family, response regulator
MRILLIDDEPEVRVLISAWFEKAGHDLDWRASGEEGLRQAARRSYDAIILDIRMPGLDGFEVLAALRKAENRTPVMMLTSLTDEEDIIDALGTGADGYMTKPFSPAELEARVEALCRRASAESSSEPVELVCGDIHLDRLARTVRRAGKTLRLTNIEFDMLSVLMTDPERTVSRPELLSEVWNLNRDPGTGLVHVHMSNLRDKLGKTGGVNAILTVRGQGYVMDPLLESGEEEESVG